MFVMKIFIKDLNEGIHEFQEEIPAQNIELSEPEFYPNPLLLNLYVDRLDNIYRIKINVKTRAKYICDRCLDPFDKEVDESIEQIYQLGSGALDEDGEVEILPPDTKEIQIDDVIQEVFIMSRPIKSICSDSCKGLCNICGMNLNIKKCKCENTNIDPRLEELKSLLN
jgi:uncharacterized protein